MNTPINTGGPAFPRPASLDQRDAIDVDIDHVAEQDGMSLRDWFAGQCLTAIVGLNTMSVKQTAEYAYKVADAMIAARSEKGGTQ